MSDHRDAHSASKPGFGPRDHDEPKVEGAQPSAVERQGDEPAQDMPPVEAPQRADLGHDNREKHPPHATDRPADPPPVTKSDG